MNNKASIPWVEKYRPVSFDNIVLDPLNKQILENIITTTYFPNLLFYGPPGTGKTTTITNLVKEYQQKLNQYHKGLMIHLNASDERGVELIRTQIQQFVNSKSLFNEGMKFVILDEVDYMTKSAQQALRYLIMNYSQTVRFCLICNYISKVDEKLQNEFLKIRFNNLPENHIISFLETIIQKEELQIKKEDIQSIQKMYDSDIRSMVNYIQGIYANSSSYKQDIFNEKLLEQLYDLFTNNKSCDIIISHIQNISLLYKITQKNIIKKLLNYIVIKKTDILDNNMLLFMENILHTQQYNINHYILYTVYQLLTFIPKV